MMPQSIDRAAMKAQMRTLLRSAQVPAPAITGLYLGLLLMMDLADCLAAGSAPTVLERGLPGLFVYILTLLAAQVLSAGFVLYCMRVREERRAEFTCLFDGFSFAGNVILLQILIFFFTFLWSLLFMIPGIVAGYRYRFALFNLCQHPEMSPLEALEMSKAQTYGYKGQLFMLDVSYLGWFLLSNLPAIAINYTVWAQLLTTPAGSPVVYTGLAALPVLEATAFVGIWGLLVQLLFLPVYQCMNLGYFEIAKSTSGVGADPSLPWGGQSGDGDGGPDGLGGF